MAKTNYHQIRRQKELAKKTRQQEKQQKRLAAKTSTPDAEAASAAEDPGSLGPSTGSEGV